MEKNPYESLILIPATLVMNLFVFKIAPLMDVYLIPWDPDMIGTPFPVITLVLMMAMPIFDVIIAIIAVVIMVVRLIRQKK
ncbi:hypothetical protein SAMN04487770_102228 [Butyrivibrio sp. ob235]|uniref:hypothetical protein n=1 Tax=unclassified Butyrivibrio TaxID=2639466 RepID=UPI0003B43E38|nr:MULTISPECIES: hypothetical protein [unclassified Butyrivibrio]SEK67477.1 hypothetical protein SAMN04487770_102228 [Butyrivibrio sp. ob235]